MLVAHCWSALAASHQPTTTHYKLRVFTFGDTNLFLLSYFQPATILPEMGNYIAYFTPISGVAGGLIIGLSAASLLLLSGDILGASGILSSVFLSPKKAVTDPSMAWKLVFLSSFSLLSSLVLGRYFTQDDRLGNDPSIPVVSTAGYLVAGFFVGFGTQLGNGCTSGHGICGMARLSVRSLAAVGTFMITAFAVAALTAPENAWASEATAWLRTSDNNVPDFYNFPLGIGVTCVVAVLPTLVALWNLWRSNKNTSEDSNASSSPTNLVKETSEVDATVPFDAITDDLEDPAVSEASRTDSASGSNHENNDSTSSALTQRRDAVRKVASGCLSGLLFAVGLAVSGMVQPSKVFGFLNFYLFAQGSYDPTLLTVMMSGCAVSFAAYQLVPGHNLLPSACMLTKPVLTSQFSVPCNQQIDWKLMVGAVCFGIGWYVKNQRLGLFPYCSAGTLYKYDILTLCFFLPTGCYRAIGGLCPGPAMFLASTGTKPVLFYYWPLYIVGSYCASILKEKF